jgi:cell division protein FtsZ
MFELMDATANAVIKVIGVGGGGGNAVEHMVGATSRAWSSSAPTPTRRRSSTRGQDHAADRRQHHQGPGRGRQSRRSAARRRWKTAIASSSCSKAPTWCSSPPAWAAAPAPARRRWWRRSRKELGILTVAVVTKPFPFEGKQAHAVADHGIEELVQHVDSLITIPNEKLLTVLGRDTTLLDAFKAANDVLLGAVQGIADLITRPGLINVDFADVRTVMSEMGMAMMGSGVGARREPRARSRPRPPSQPAARGHQPAGAKRHPGQRHRRPGPRSASSRRSVGGRRGTRARSARTVGSSNKDRDIKPIRRCGTFPTQKRTFSQEKWRT